MSGNVNFNDYLLKYEHCLCKDDPSKHDGKLDQEEISIFFSGAHLEIGSNSSGDGTFSEVEFDKWYDANESAITRYYQTLDGYNEGDYEKLRNEMMDAMVTFMEQNSNNVLSEQSIDGFDTVKMSDVDATDLGAKVTPGSAKVIADKLFDATQNKLGTDQKVLDKYLGSNKLSSKEVVMIMNAYNNLRTGKSLIEAIQSDYLGSDKEEPYREKLYDSVVNVAQSKSGWKTENDIPENIKKLAEKFKDKLSKDSALFFMSDFNAKPSQEKAQILIAYEIMYGDSARSALQMVTDKVWFGEEDSFTSGMIDSLLEYTNS